MNKSLLCLFLVGYFTPIISQATFKESLSIKNVWSISGISKDQSKIALRFKGEEDFSQITQYENTGVAQIIDTENWQVISEFGNVRFMNFSPDSTMAYVLFNDTNARIIDLEKNIPLKELSNVWSIHFSPDNKLIKIVFYDKTQILDAHTWKLIKEFTNTGLALNGFSSDNKKVAITFTDGRTSLFNIENWDILKEFTHLTQFGLTFSPYNRYVAIINKNHNSTILTTKDWSESKSFENIQLSGFSEKEHYLWIKDNENIVQIIDLNNWQVIHQESDVLFHQISPDERYVWFVFRDKTCMVIDIQSGETVINDIHDVEECGYYATQKIAIAVQDEILLYDLL